MHVGIDGRALASTRAARGVAHYTAAMLAALADAFPDDRYTVLVPDSERTPATLPASPAVCAHTTRVPGRLLYGAAALTGRPRLDRLMGGVDVVWSPAPAPLAVSGGLPLVLTLHDLSFVRRPRDFTGYERAWHALARPAARARGAARVVAVSLTTRELALDRWKLDPDRVVVVHPGVTRPAAPPAAAAIAAARERHRLGQRYLLFVGALEPRKAPDLLARAFARARVAGLDAELAVVGEGRLRATVSGNGIRLLGGGLARPQLEALYAGALALVAPSRDEGFGLPPLEAAACSTPSVLTDLPAFAETLGDAALRVASGDEEALANGMCRIAGSAELRSQLGAAAQTAAARFTWEQAARELHAELHAAVGDA